MNKSDCNYGVCGLVALFHMPPWYPWLRIGKTGNINEILEKLRDKGLDIDDDFEVIRNKIQDSGEDREVRENALIIPLVLKKRIQDPDYESILEKVINSIVKKDSYWIKVNEAGEIASSLNRILVKEALKEENKQNIFPESIVFINIFSPKYAIKGEIINPRKGIDSSLIAEFISEYTKIVSDVINKIEISQKVSNKLDKGMLLLHVAFLLLEPIWYKTTSIVEENEKGIVIKRLLVPPADPRIPIHTIFDYINSILSTLLLLDGGCIVMVDLADVQGFISESRRLRDLWASSWLVSFLSWASIKDIVKEYGPGVLIRPPGRLHPFYSTMIMGAYLDNQDKEEDWLYAALGIPVQETAGEDYRWPALATVPSQNYIAVPRELCDNNEYRNKIIKSYTDAWHNLLKGALEEVADLINIQYNGKFGASGLVEEIEPPLSIRIYASKPEFNGSDEIERAIAYEKALLEIFVDRLVYKVTAPGRGAGENSYKLVNEIYNLGRVEYCLVCGKSLSIIDGEEIREKIRNNPAIAKHKNNEVIWSLLEREIFNEKFCPYCIVKRLLRRVLEKNNGLKYARDLVGLSLKDRRLPRWDSVNDFTTRLASIRGNYCENPIYKNILLENVRTKLSISNIIINSKHNNGSLTNTSGLDDFINEMRKLNVGRLDRPRELFEEFSKILEEKLNPSDDSSRHMIRTIAEYLWYIIWEGLISYSIIDNLIENSKNSYKKLFLNIYNIIKSFRDLPRRYGVLVADGDNMGSGLLLARLPKRAVIKNSESGDIAAPEDYLSTIAQIFRGEGGRNATAIANIIEERASQKLDSAVKRIISFSEKLKILKKHSPNSFNRTLYVYPSYHFTVSRALSLISQLDTKKVTEHGGQIVYAGGDDVLAIVPPATICSGENIFFNGLEIAADLRRNWWGEDPQFEEPIKGFIMLRSNKYILHVAPAPSAYGRSSALFLADALYPMWLTLSVARMLEELKDDFYQELNHNNSHIKIMKDMFVVASDSRGLSYTTAKPIKGLTAGTIDSVIKLLRIISGERLIAHNIYNDIITNKKIIIRILNKENIDLLGKFMINIIKENITEEGKRINNDKLSKSKEILRAIQQILYGNPKTINKFSLDLYLETKLSDPTERLHHLLTDYTANPFLDRENEKYPALNNNLLFSLFSVAYVYDSALPAPSTVKR